jgi:hypothetical protein
MHPHLRYEESAIEHLNSLSSFNSVDFCGLEQNAIDGNETKLRFLEEFALAGRTVAVFDLSFPVHWHIDHIVQLHPLIKRIDYVE